MKISCFRRLTLPTTLMLPVSAAGGAERGRLNRRRGSAYWTVSGASNNYFKEHPYSRPIDLRTWGVLRKIQFLWPLMITIVYVTCTLSAVLSFCCKSIQLSSTSQPPNLYNRCKFIIHGSKVQSFIFHISMYLLFFQLHINLPLHFFFCVCVCVVKHTFIRHNMFTAIW